MFASGDGSSLVYYRETEKGLGIYFCEYSQRQTQDAVEQRENGYMAPMRQVGWSPDSRLLACAYKNDTDPQKPKRKIQFRL